MVTALFLAVAILAFAGLGYQTVPMSATQTITQESTNVVTYLRTNSYPYTTFRLGMEPSCYGIPEAPYYPCNYATLTGYRSDTSAIYYSKTATRSITESSTRIVPASAALGLTNGSLAIPAVVIIGILALLTAYLILKPRTTHKPKQSTLTQFAKASSSCVKCGAELPPVSEFCNKCGTKQTE
jgi:zinc-ribbon domain